MNFLKQLFTKHPHSIGETYWHHMINALLFGSQMVIGGIACLIHAIFPFLFQETASNLMFRMTMRFVNRMPHEEIRVKKMAQCLKKKYENDMSISQ